MIDRRPNSLIALLLTYLLTIVIAGQTTGDIRPLTTQPIERELKGGDAHSYSLVLEAGQFVYVVVEQKGIDVMVTLFDPNNKSVREVDSPNGMQGPEPVMAIAEMTGNYRMEVRSLDASAALGYYETHIVEIRKAKETDRPLIDAQILEGEGNVLQVQQTAESFRAALKKYDEAVRLFRTASDKRGEANTLNSIGFVYDNLGDKEQALKFYKESLPLFRAIGDQGMEATALGNIGLVYSDTGDKVEAFKFYDEALKLFQITGDKNSQGIMLGNLGRINQDLGENQLALNYYEKALPLNRAVGNRLIEANTLNNIGTVLRDLGKRREALQYYDQSLQISRELANKLGEAGTLGNIGVVHSDLGETQQALKSFYEALPLFRAGGDKLSEADMLNDIGLVHDNLGEFSKAREFYEQAVPLYRVVGNKRTEANVLNNIAYSWSESGNHRLGALYGKLAIGRYQTLRTNVQGLDKNAQRAFLKSIELAYRQLAERLILEHRDAEAQEVLNSFKDQQAFDPGQSERAPLSMTPTETTLASSFDREVKSVVAAIRAVDSLHGIIADREPTADESAELKKLDADLKAASAGYNAFAHAAAGQTVSPETSSDRLATTADLESIQTQLRDISKSTGQESVAIYQLVGVENFYSLIVTSDAIRSVSTPKKSKLLNQQARKFWALLQSPNLEPRPTGQSLYDVVFKPIENELPSGTKTILWSLDGNLRYIPMDALYDGKRYLVERYNSVTFTRADSGRLTRAISPKWTATALGSSKAHNVDILGKTVSLSALPGVTDELRTVFGDPKSKHVIDGQTLLDASFTRSAMLASLSQKRPVVHIASHFSFRPGDDASSFLLLGDGSAFTLSDMSTQKDMFAGVELLTLSACNTAAQQADANGREVDAFFELAQRLGAQSVLATLWPVADNSTPWLMREFYDLKIRKQENKAQALRDAQLALLNGSARAARSATRADVSPINIVVVPDGTTRTDTRADEFVIESKDAKPYNVDQKRPFAHPFYWSPFVLIGNWR